jgi:hypothetical protein
MYSNLATSLIDYECVGQRVWLFVCAISVPNILILVKTLTN